MVRLGAFDDVDIAIMVHASSQPEDGDLAVGGTNNGMVAKFVRFLRSYQPRGWCAGQGHQRVVRGARGAGGHRRDPRDLQRRGPHSVHPIVTRGGDVVNAIPADVRLEMFCRGATTEAIELAHRKVDRALKAGALAVRRRRGDYDLAGYLPLFHDPNLVALFRANAVDLVGAGNVREKGHGGGSTDMGDLSHILPTVHPYPRWSNRCRPWRRLPNRRSHAGRRQPGQRDHRQP